jgi:hypothetical protein
METLISALRLLVNLADSSYEWCLPILRSPFALPTLLRIISSYRPVPLDATAEPNSAHGEAEANKLDVMCLALSLVTSIVQEVKQGKVQISKTSKHQGLHGFDTLSSDRILLFLHQNLTHHVSSHDHV